MTMMITRRRLALVAAAALMPVNTRIGNARQITKIVVPFPAGTSSDTITRIIGGALQERLQRTFVIVNRHGANGTIGTGEFVHASPDGNALLSASSATFSGAPQLFNQLPYNPLEDFVPVSLVGTFSIALLVASNIPVTDLRSFLSYLEANKGALWYGQGNPTVKILAEQLGFASGVAVKGQALGSENKVINELLAGRIQWGFATPSAALGHVAAGNIKALALGTPGRSVLMPNLQTITEVGLPNFIPLTSWMGLVAPAGFPASSAEELGKKVREVMELETVRSAMLKFDFSLKWMPPREFTDFIATEGVKWAKVVSHLKIEKI